MSSPLQSDNWSSQDAEKTLLAPGDTVASSPERVGELTFREDIIRDLIADYRGAFSLGVVRSRRDPSQFALYLRLQGEPPLGIPSRVLVDGEPVEVIVECGWLPTAPAPQA